MLDTSKYNKFFITFSDKTNFDLFDINVSSASMWENGVIQSYVSQMGWSKII